MSKNGFKPRCRKKCRLGEGGMVRADGGDPTNVKKALHTLDKEVLKKCRPEAGRFWECQKECRKQCQTKCQKSVFSKVSQKVSQNVSDIGAVFKSVKRWCNPRDKTNKSVNRLYFSIRSPFRYVVRHPSRGRAAII